MRCERATRVGKGLQERKQGQIDESRKGEKELEAVNQTKIRERKEKVK